MKSYLYFKDQMAKRMLSYGLGKCKRALGSNLNLNFTFFFSVIENILFSQKICCVLVFNLKFSFHIFNVIWAGQVTARKCV